MKQRDRFEMLGLAVFTGMLFVLLASSQPSLAASQSPGSACTVSFDGRLSSFQLSPEGGWGLASSSCQITGQANGTTSGTFSGSFSSAVFNGTVSGTWSISGSTEKIVASSTTFSMSVSVDQSVDGMPVLGSPYQGVLSGAGIQGMFVLGTTGQVTLG